MKKVLIIGGIIAVGALIMLAVNKRKSQGMKVHVEMITMGEITESVSASGRIQPEMEIKISPDVSGEIIALLVKEGELVQKGDLLIKIKPDLYQSYLERSEATLKSTKSNLASARARLTEASLDYDRNSKLFEQEALSKADLDRSESNFKQNKANVESLQFQVKSAEAGVKESKNNLGFTSIYAPVSGTVSKLNVEEGERVVGTAQMTGTEILRLANLTEMEVLVEVSETDIIRVSVGDSCSIEVDAYFKEKFDGVVTEVANSAKTSAGGLDQVSNFEVKVRILKDSYSELLNKYKNPFRPGMTATVDVLTESSTGILVPIQSVTLRVDSSSMNPTGKKPSFEKEMECVFLYKDGKVTKTAVKTGIQDDRHIELLSGPSEGEWVVSAPYKSITKKLKTGMKVDTVNLDELYKKD